MKKRKYITEYAISFCSGDWSMMTAHQLMSDGVPDNASKEILDKCHIYVIASRPSSSFKESSFEYKDGKISGDILYKINGVEHSLSFSDMDYPLLDGATHLKISPYPHKELLSCDDNDDVKRYFPADVLATIINSKEDLGVFNTFKVLYVGQSFGNGNRTALDRLKSHSTLQKILARTPYEYPDQEIVIFTFHYDDPQMVSSMDGRAEGAINSDENERRLFNAIENPPDKKQQISLIEAGLIRYFQPPYNEMFVYKFPSTKLKVLKSCYDLDISGLFVEINTEEYEFYLYSDKVKPSLHHMAQFDLLAPKDRASFFNIAGINSNPDVINALS